jgi:hypothetical protein
MPDTADGKRTGEGRSDALYQYRVFLSYCHKDKEGARKLRDFLKGLDLEVMWDEKITAGNQFSDEIRRDISRAHLFVALITRTTVTHPWVHHETGFAMALGIPVLIVAADTDPVGMTSELQAVKVNASLEPDDLAVLIKKENIAAQVRGAETPSRGFFEQVEDPQERSKRLVVYLNGLRDSPGVYGLGKIRQDALLTSFSIPRFAPPTREWDQTEGIASALGYAKSFRDERAALEEHAATSGCKLMFDPAAELLAYGEHAVQVRCARLTTLRGFLDSMKDEQVQIVRRPEGIRPNVTIVGDWFVAVAHPGLRPQDGYQQTLFTWHAPTVRKYVRDFDAEFEELSDATDFRGRSSREWAIDLINNTLDKIPVTAE